MTDGERLILAENRSQTRIMTHVSREVTEMRRWQTQHEKEDEHRFTRLETESRLNKEKAERLEKSHRGSKLISAAVASFFGGAGVALGHWLSKL